MVRMKTDGRTDAPPTLHMMYERMAPDEPMSAPTIVIRLLFIMKPSAHSAQPE